jgi:D-amino-acid dehydrogenase
MVLGAGAVGVSVALHLLARGRAVTLVDPRPPGTATSYGNAGLIEATAAAGPVPFPRAWRELARYAGNRATAVRYDPLYMARRAGWFLSDWSASAPAALARAASVYAPFVERAAAEHRAQARRAGPEAEARLRDGGWIEAWRSARSLAAARAEDAAARARGVACESLDAAGIAALEPRYRGFVGGRLWRGALTVTDPGGLVAAWARAFAREGGTVLQAEARTLAPDPRGWRATGPGLDLVADEAVAALGPWSGDVLARLGLHLPTAVKRGYHRHFAPEGGPPALPLIDSDEGFVLAPMAQGVRLTTGVEFAERDAPSSPAQIARAERIARATFPLGAAVEAEPWLGARPCLPDMMPAIGPAPGRPGLWLAFGHNHHGLTLGPATGRCLAEMMSGERPTVDMTAFAPDRFRRAA